CAECGYDVDEYVAALGSFGGWLLHLERGGVLYRLFWNGRAKELVLEEHRERSGWAAVRSTETDDKGLPGFVQAVRGLLQDDSPAAGASS
ncbi:MAG: hypothetical protein KJP03_03555, partial [Gammaproteobacteria bacterium]|nr:hypothetical protein [Gammaproteobacteria bacterium]